MIFAVNRRINVNKINKKGGFDNLLNYLVEQKIEVLQLNLPLRKIDLYSIALFKDGKLIWELYFGSLLTRIPLFLRIIFFDTFVILFCLLRITVYKKNRILIASESYSAFFFIFLKKLKFVEKWIQHIPDYRPVNYRFNNKFIDYIYELSFRIVLANSDCITYPNIKIFNALKKEFKINSKKQLLITNTFKPNNKKYSCNKKYDYIIMPSLINENSRLIQVINCLRPFLNQENRKLHIFGEMNDKVYFNKIINLINKYDLNSNVILYGQVNITQINSALKKCCLGIALYGDLNDYKFNNFGDSLKIRHFAANAIPVIGTIDIDPMGEIYRVKGGIGVKSEREFVDALRYFNIKNNYLHASRQILDWSKSIWNQYQLNLNELKRFIFD